MKIDKCMDERWIRKWVLLPIDQSMIIPDFAIVTRMGTVPVAICIDEGCEAWKLPKWHFGHALFR
jgi:hypothetical protein